MAAGRPDVSRRREYYSYGYHKKEEVVRYKNGSRDAKLGHRGDDHKCKHGYPFLPNEHKGRGQAGLDDAPCVKNGEVSKCDDGVQLPPEKKFKFSPIIWDLEEKEVRISSKNRIALTSNALSCLKSPASSVSEVLNIVSDGDVAKSPVLENQVKALEELSSDKLLVASGSAESTTSDSRMSLSPPLPQKEQIGYDDLDKMQLEDDEFVPTKNISMSRWASDSDSPRNISLSDGEDSPKRESQASKMSTPESGEFCRESSGDGSRLSESDEVGVHLSNDEDAEIELEEDVMHTDKTHGDDTDFERLEVEEPIVPGHRSMNMLEGCRSVFEFERLNKINEGTYGIVYRARDKKTGKIVALKKVKMNVGRKEDYLEYGFPISSLREINILLSFIHPAIVDVKEVVMDDHNSVYMVMEYMEHDVKGLMESMKQPFSTSEVKCLMLQLLEGVKYLHDNWVLHRDLKTSNLLLDNRGKLKICDFGMSRQYGSPLKPYTSLVVTLWYRAPELLLGAKKYSTAVDMWSVGCIMAELLAKKPLFSGTSEVDQLEKIFKTLGTPTEKIWPGLSKLPGAKANFVKQPYNLLRKRFPAASFTGSPVLSELGFDLLNKFLTYDPEKRITVDDALNHEWFWEVPLPKSKEFMPTFPPQHAQNR
ncbi:Kinase family protein [Melia azedarach]|uniref:Kinase family protein n=1 Tax=Melia azedarach TaxID=155640 RepID=A0ACC1XN01_MELAZ|nr:Kinase family protein [Melia azedarach]